MNSNVTIVTGLWDMGRGRLRGWAKRDFEVYKSNFLSLLEADVQMCVWIPQELEQEVLEARKGKPTKIFIKDLKDFEEWNPFFKDIDKIRKRKKWINTSSWLKDSPQAKLKYYNPMMFTKMFMVNDSAVTDPFNSEYYFWIDGGLSSTVPLGYFTHDNVLNNLENYIDANDRKFLHITYPYTANNEIHGFDREGMAKYCGIDFVENISRGGFWGGHKEELHKLNALYYEVMESTLKEGYMGADECLFTILAHRHQDLIKAFKIKGDGLVWPFFEELKKYNVKSNRTALYIVTFNFPEQLRYLLQSYEGTPFLNKTQKFLIDNSTDESTFEEFDKICEEYDFERIKQDNIGICGGRQYAAEHFENTDCDYMIFLEDDMLLNNGEQKCKLGFPSKVDNLLEKVTAIMDKEQYDFLKLSFSEFYGTNSDQWSWYNVPQNIREEVWPDNSQLPEKGTSDKCPKTSFNNIKSLNGLPYADGEIYYSNWPQIVSKAGNKKLFLDTKWDYPFEQTWMSNAFQLSRKGEISSAVILSSPIFHDRKHFYEAEERVESKPFTLQKET